MREIGARDAAWRRTKRTQAPRSRVTPTPAPQAVERLRRLFPEAWAWYELLAAARGVADRPDEPPDRSVGSA
jgi:hypothetical protein